MRKILICTLVCMFSICLSSEAKEHTSENLDDQKQFAPTMANPTDLIVTTTPSVDGYRVKEYKGIVRGVIVRQPTVGQGLSAGIERLAGGKISAYEAMADRAREQALETCISRARALGANALIGLAYDSSAFNHGDNVEIEVVCYGTAVTIERDGK